MTLGLFNKVVLADSFLSNIAERIYDSDKVLGALDAWAATLVERCNPIRSCSGRADALLEATNQPLSDLLLAVEMIVQIAGTNAELGSNAISGSGCDAVFVAVAPLDAAANFPRATKP